MKLKILRIAAVAFWGLGCTPLGPVTINGKLVPRERLTFTGWPYTLTHDNAHPRGAEGASTGLRDAGGGIKGRVCGANVNLEVEHKGDGVQLVGTVDGEFTMQLWAEDKAGVLTITGSLATQVVNLRLGRDGLLGYVGRFPYELLREGDRLVRRIRVNNGAVRTYEIPGFQDLLAMPPADQAALLPLFLDCTLESAWLRDNNVADKFRFGGPGADAPPGTLRFRNR